MSIKQLPLDHLRNTVQYMQDQAAKKNVEVTKRHSLYNKLLNEIHRRTH